MLPHSELTDCQHNHTTYMSTTHDSVEAFFSAFDTPPKGKDILSKAQHWLAAFQSPEHFHPQATEIERQHYRRLAKQNLRRLLNRHPELLSKLQSHLSRPESQ